MVNKNKVLLFYEICMQLFMLKVCSGAPNFQKMDKHAGGKWLIHDTQHRKANQSQSLELPCRISYMRT